MIEGTSEENVTLKNVSLLSGNLLSTTVDNMARDMKFFAIFYVVMGGLSCLSIIGAVYGIPLIIYSLKLKDAADEFRRFSDSKDFYMLQKAIENQRKFFFFQKIIIIITIAFFVLYLLVILWFGFSLFSDIPTGKLALSQ